MKASMYCFRCGKHKDPHHFTKPLQSKEWCNDCNKIPIGNMPTK